MKKTLLLAFSIFFIFSCGSDEEVYTLDVNELRVIDVVTNFSFNKTCNDSEDLIPIQVGKIGPAATTALNYSVTVDMENTTAVEGVHYTLPSNTGSIPAGEFISELNIMVNSNNYADEESVELALIISSTDLDVDSDNSAVTLALTAECSQDLSGDMDFTHTDLEGNEYSGTVTFTNTIGTNDYKISDFSYGIYGSLGEDPPSGSIKLVNDCCTIEYVGTDSFLGVAWSIDEIIESGGSVLTYRWSNEFSFADVGGTVSLTRQDGQNWPFLSLK